MRIKKHPTNNEYVRAADTWVRNFTKNSHASLQISHLFSSEDHKLILKNEEHNKNFPRISDEKLHFKKVAIVSDGYDFDRRHEFLAKVPKDVCVLVVNGALKRWKLMSSKWPAEQRRSINGFVANNPYAEAMRMMPGKDSRYYPACIASARTNNDFLKKYMGDVYVYVPTPEERFGTARTEAYYIDDYRNPVCAAVGLAYRFGVERLMLVCCDDSFADKRDSSVKLPNGLHTYPQHLKCHDIIDANLYWLTHQGEAEVKVADYSNGPNYSNAAYISSEEAAISFYADPQEGTTHV